VLPTDIAGHRVTPLWVSTAAGGAVSEVLLDSLVVVVVATRIRRYSVRSPAAVGSAGDYRLAVWQLWGRGVFPENPELPPLWVI